MKKHLFITALAGTIVEYYDYALYGFSAAILAAHFFPSDDITVSLIKTFGIFAAGSMAKPFGALIFGHIGDHKGRRISLRFSMMGIAVPTTVIGLLPGYESWGWGAPLALLFCRFAQGFFLAGEYDGVVLYLLEQVKHRRRCFANSLVSLASFMGIYLASSMISIVMLIEKEGPNWLWRIPFYIGGGLGVIILGLRRNLTETPSFLYHLKTHSHPIMTFKALLQNHWRSLLTTFLICGAAGGSYHFYIIFWSTYCSTVHHLFSVSQSAFFISMMTLLLAIFSPIAGIVGDYLGPRHTLQGASFALLIMGIVNGYYVSCKTLPFWVMGMTATIMPFFLVPGHAYIIQNFPIETRFRGMSLGHALASILLSGSAPVISIFFWQATNIIWFPLLYFLALTFLMLMALFITQGQQKFTRWKLMITPP